MCNCGNGKVLVDIQHILKDKKEKSNTKDKKVKKNKKVKKDKKHNKSSH